MNIIKRQLELLRSNEPFVTATVVEAKGSTPAKSGFKIIVDSDGNTFGTVGGGAIEYEVISHCRKLLIGGENQFRKYVLSAKETLHDDSVKIVPMMCRGSLNIFYEVNKMKPEVYIFGGGHVGQALLRVLPNLSYHVKLIDNREEFCNNNIAPGADEYICSDYLSFVDSFDPHPNSYLISLTHGHSFDYEILKRIFLRKLSVKYIGVIASESKSKELKEKLHKEVRPDIDFSNLYSPIGLKIGGDSADEIALSIAAELQSVRYSKKIIVES